MINLKSEFFACELRNAGVVKSLGLYLGGKP